MVSLSDFDATNHDLIWWQLETIAELAKRPQVKAQFSELRHNAKILCNEGEFS